MLLRRRQKGASLLTQASQAAPGQSRLRRGKFRLRRADEIPCRPHHGMTERMHEHDPKQEPETGALNRRFSGKAIRDANPFRSS
jgi:hypothetical protein